MRGIKQKGIPSRLLVALFCLQAFLPSCVKENDDIPDGIINYVEVGDPVPLFSVHGDGEDVFNSSSFKNKRSLLVFFVTTCGDCDRELPKAQKVWEILQADDEFQVITIARKEELSAVEEYWKKKGYTMPFYLDLDRSVFDLFANSTIPRFYVIDPEGVITWMGIETIELSAEEIVEKMRNIT